MRPLMSVSSPAPSTMVVSSLVTTTLRGLAEQVEGDVLELEADLLGDDLAAGEDRHVLQHRLAALAEAGRLDGHALERAADLVDDERGQGLALDVLGDDHERLAGLHDLLEHGQQVAHGRDLRADEQDVGVLEDRLHALGVGDEVRGDVALVEAHALDEVHLHAEGLRLLDGDDAVLADLVDRLGDHGPDLGVGGRDRRHLGDLVLGLGVLGESASGWPTAASTPASMPLLSDIGLAPAATLRRPSWTMRPGEHGGGGRAVTGDVVGLLGDFLDQLGADPSRRDPRARSPWRWRRRRW